MHRATPSAGATPPPAALDVSADMGGVAMDVPMDGIDIDRIAEALASEYGARQDAELALATTSDLGATMGSLRDDGAYGDLEHSVGRFQTEDEALPHVVSVVNPADFTTATMPCDLVTLRVCDIRAYAESWFAPAAAFELFHNGMFLSDGAKALDAGIGNGGVVVMQPLGQEPPRPPPDPMSLPAMAGGQQSVAGESPATVVGTPVRSVQTTPVKSLLSVEAAPFLPPGHLAAPQHATPPPRALLPQHHGFALPLPPPPPHMVDPYADPYAYPVGHAPSLHGAAAAAASPSPPPPPCGDFISLAVTSEGSASLIEALMALEDPTAFVEQLLAIVKPRFFYLASCHHSSRVLHVITKLGNDDQKRVVLDFACRDLATLAEDVFGAEVICGLIQETGKDAAFHNEDGVPFLAAHLAHSIVRVGTNVNGRKVIQTCVQAMGPDQSRVVYEAAIQHMQSLCRDQCGCITLQRLLEWANKDMSAKMLDTLFQCAPAMLTDPYGNYVLQHCVKDHKDFSLKLCQLLSGHLLTYGVNKFASNVIEKCLKTCSPAMMQDLLGEVCADTNLNTLMRDPYGNYVVQSIVDNCSAEQLEVFKEHLMPLMGQSPYGYRIESKLQKRLKRNSVSRTRTDKQRKADILAAEMAKQKLERELAWRHAQKQVPPLNRPNAVEAETEAPAESTPSTAAAPEPDTAAAMAHAP